MATHENRETHLRKSEHCENRNSAERESARTWKHESAERTCNTRKHAKPAKRFPHFPVLRFSIFSRNPDRTRGRPRPFRWLSDFRYVHHGGRLRYAGPRRGRVSRPVLAARRPGTAHGALRNRLWLSQRYLVPAAGTSAEMSN